MLASIVVSPGVWCWLALADLPTRTPSSWSPRSRSSCSARWSPSASTSARRGTDHIAERYGLLVIITLGEGLLGTMAALAVLIEGGWSTDIVILGIAGTLLPFGLWWTYFVVPNGPLLRPIASAPSVGGTATFRCSRRLVAVGSGLHVAAYRLDHHSELGDTATVLTVAVPLAVYLSWLYVLYAQITRTMDPFHLLLIAGTVVVLVGAVLLSVLGFDLIWCLLARTRTVGHRGRLRDRRTSPQREVLAALEG